MEPWVASPPRKWCRFTSLQTASLADANHVTLSLGLNSSTRMRSPGLKSLIALPELEFVQELRAAVDARFLQVAAVGLVQPSALPSTDRPEWHRSHRWPASCAASRRTDQPSHGHRYNLTVGPEHLRHPDFLAKNSWAHIFSFLSRSNP